MQSKTDMLVNATQEGGLIENLFVAADTKVAPFSNCIGKFLNEEADAGAAAFGNWQICSHIVNKT